MHTTTTSTAAYTRNGARRLTVPSPPPTSGPTTLPSRNPVAHIPEARPRMRAGASRMSSDSADTVNIVEPIPPSPRSRSSCQ